MDGVGRAVLCHYITSLDIVLRGVQDEVQGWRWICISPRPAQGLAVREEQPWALPFLHNVLYSCPYKALPLFPGFIHVQ